MPKKKGKKKPAVVSKYNTARNNLKKAMEAKADGVVMASRQPDTEDAIFSKELVKRANILTPPYDPFKMCSVSESNSILPQCIEAMVRNVDGFGYELQFTGDAGKEEDPDTLKEKAKLEGFLNRVNESQSFMSVRKQVREDIERLGYGFIEVIRAEDKSISLLYWMDAKFTRLQAKQKEATEITVKLIRGDKEIPVKIQKRFRRYAMYTHAMSGKIKFFKEYGDPRKMDALTGEYEGEVKEGKEITEEATEVIHIKLGNSTYGIPRWAGHTATILGTTSADYVNYDLFENQVVPPLAIMVSGGRLTSESVDDIANILIKKKGVTNFNKVLILEAQSEGNVDDKDRTKVEMKELSQARKEDSMFNEYLKLADIRVRSAFRLPPLYLGRSETYSKSCYSEDTQTLTEFGWKYYYEIIEGEKIATYNPESMAIEYHIPNGGLRIFEHEGDMIHFCNRNIDVMVTPNHDMWFCRQYDYQSGSIEFNKVKAGDLLEERGKMLSAPMNPVKYDGHLPSIFSVPYIPHGCRSKHYSKENYRDPIPDNLFIELIGWIVTDGCPTTENRPDMNYIGFGFSKQRKISRISNLLTKLENCGFIVYRGKKDINGTQSFHINDLGLYTWVVEHCGRHAKNKVLPFKISELSENQLSLLLDTVIFCDGTIDSRKGRNNCGFFSTSVVLIDQVQQIAFLLGHRAHKINDNRLSITLNKPIFEINKYQIDYVPYSGKVYCYNVPNHLFVTRRNGKIAIQGNTADSSKMVGEEQVFVPERAEFDEIVNMTLMSDLESKNWTFKSKGPRLISGEDVVTATEAFANLGALTINDTIKIANNILGRDIQEYDEDWAKFPIPIVIELAKQGALEGIDSIISMTSLTTQALNSTDVDDEDGVKKAALLVALKTMRKTLVDHRVEKLKELKAV